MASATVASAATIDYNTLAAAAGFGETGVANGTTLNVDGVNITFDAGAGSVAFIDDEFATGGEIRPGGLGVCSSYVPADMDCDISGDDNLDAGEELTLTFDDQVEFILTAFLDQAHLPVDTGDSLMIGTDGGVMSSYTFADALSATFFGITSISFGHAGTDYYIAGATVNPIPVPAAGFLLLGGLGGLAAMKRRKKA
ncbi:MAG: VPLPA-CTERM sorting domain-containing protein [Boseongicola sp.]|nr:VPLPA-CTERM sorting domain-containing protein [Boseongicola sp.]